MIFEATITNIIVDKNGNDKIQKKSYILENVTSFSDAEALLINEFGHEAGFDVCAIKISKLKEIINEAPQGDTECKIFFATIVDVFVDDNENIKEIPYTIALFAHNMTEAKVTVDQYVSQGLEDMELTGLRCTKFIDVLK